VCSCISFCNARNQAVRSSEHISLEQSQSIGYRRLLSPFWFFRLLHSSTDFRRWNLGLEFRRHYCFVCGRRTLRDSDDNPAISLPIHHSRNPTVSPRLHLEGLDSDSAKRRNRYGSHKHLCPAVLYPNLLPIRSGRFRNSSRYTTTTIHHLPRNDEPRFRNTPPKAQILVSFPTRKSFYNRC
jgi:hypothetical protein